jgi:hypothetical protein
MHAAAAAEESQPAATCVPSFNSIPALCWRRFFLRLNVPRAESTDKPQSIKNAAYKRTARSCIDTKEGKKKSQNVGPSLF